MKMKKQKATALLMALVLASGALAGCKTSTTGAAATASGSKNDLNSMSLAQITAEAKKEGSLQSVGMPDDWANWGDTWTQYTAKYGIKHQDTDMSSAEELAIFQSEKNNPTKDIGDVGQSFGPLAVQKDLVQAYKTPYWNDIPSWAKDKDGKWIVGYYGTISFMTNTDSVKNPPKSWSDILNGNYKVCVGDVTKANQSQNAVLAAAIAMGGSEKNIQPGIDFFAKLAAQGRLDMGDSSMTRLEKGDVQVVILWDYLSLGYRDKVKQSGSTVNYDVTVPTDGSVEGGYAEVINKYAPHPAAAALARDYILSDQGQINLAKGYARPIRSDVKLPDDIKAKLLPDSEYKKARPVKDFDAWDKTAEQLPEMWQEQVLSKQKS